MVRGAFFAICLAQADNAPLSASHSENQNMQPMPEEANGYGARFSVTPACIGPRYGRFEVEVGRGGHMPCLATLAMFLPLSNSIAKL
jgi:hypothetical protein